MSEGCFSCNVALAYHKVISYGKEVCNLYMAIINNKRKKCELF